MKSVIFRTMGGLGIGLGHYFRCLSLAKEMRKTQVDMRIVFIINQALERLLSSEGFSYILSDDWDKDNRLFESTHYFILDSYEAGNNYLQKIRQKVRCLIIFDDNNDIYELSVADVVINGNIHANLVGYTPSSTTSYLLGTDYLVLREEYDEINEQYPLTYDVLITTGGTDAQHISYKLLQHLKEEKLRIGVIIGPGYGEELRDNLYTIEKQSKNIVLIENPSSLKEHIGRSKLVITAGGTTVYEVLRMRKNLMVYSLADNQDMLCRALEDQGITFLGRYPDIQYKKILQLKSVNKITKLNAWNTGSNGKRKIISHLMDNYEDK